MISKLQKYRVLISMLGLLVILVLFYGYISNFKHMYTNNILIKSDRFKVFHTFFTQKNLSDWFPEATDVHIAGKLEVGSSLVFKMDGANIGYKIVSLKDKEYIKWENKQSYQEFIFKDAHIGTQVRFNFNTHGPIAFFFHLLKRRKIHDHMHNTLYLLKKNVEE
jgi:hypothetical protein